MPRKVRELRRDLRRAGYYQVKGGGKGSHTKWKHPLVPDAVTLSGADGDDAHPYQERRVREAIAAARETERQQKGKQP
jgi:predicted RNA binding protein YcfA (HicA-like mRNA interferase family)